MPPEQLTLILFLLIYSVSAVKFDFGTLTLNSLKLIGDAHFKNGSIHLTRELPVPTSGSGRVLYSDPVRIRHPVTNSPIPFSTFFSFSITNLNPGSIGGGLAFILCADDKSVGDAGGFLGILDSVNPNSATVAVEFDTLMDVPFEDINGNHVGVDLNSMVSADVADLDSAGIDLKSGDLINAWIEYSEKGILQVFVSYSTRRPLNPVISYGVDLRKFVKEFMFVGFSGSTQGSTEIHCVEWWSFSSKSWSGSSSSRSSSHIPPSTVVKFPPPSSPPPVFSAAAQSPPPPLLDSVPEAESPTTVSPRSSSHCQTNGLCRQGPAAVAGVATAGAFFVAACAAVGVWAFTRRTRAIKRWTNLPPTSDSVNTPREFTYRELSSGTRNFDATRIIGHGAFGTVYKGIIPDTGAMVAVKRCIHNGNAGRQEFLSELSIIASLRHRNLVRLQGWCHEKGEILLVYDYMLHGSLDKALFEQNQTLSWQHRKKILTGVASALAYLHRDCERQVIHRDVKSSNVMLDEGYHARLGDFGLARQIDHDASPDATVTAGTMGYLAPEYLLTGRATEKTDVFSFGAVVLEVTCGRRPIDGPGPTGKGNNLVEWVWNLHGEGRTLSAVDERLGGEFDEGEMRRAMLVGLACSSPDPGLRPSMRNVVQILNGEADPPFVPVAKPSMSFSSNHQLLMSLQDSVSDYNALGLNLSTDSWSDDSLRSTLRGGGGGGSGAGG